MRRILIVRSAIEDFYEPAWVRALRDNGHQVQLFDTFAYLTPYAHARAGAGVAPLEARDRVGWWQHRLLWGPRVVAANRALLSRARAYQPDVVLMYLGHHYHGDTVAELGERSFVALYHNDDPFGPRRYHPRYRLLRRALGNYHGGHFYRPATAADACAAGLARTAVLLDSYRPWEDYPRGGSLEHEAVFIGHYEPGLRVACAVAAVRAGLPLRLFSREPGWRRNLPKDVARVAGPGPGLYGDAYREKLSRAKISVSFLSRWNRDVYTKRVFEIPACGGFLLCERSAFMQTLYEEGKEAAYFGSPDEFVDKVRFYLSHEAERRAIAAAGRERLLQSGYDIHGRLRGWASQIEVWMRELGRTRRAG